jgi:amino acid adenylation domain-containing protein
VFKDGQPIQRIAANETMSLELLQLDSLAGENSDQKITQFVRAHARTRFNLSTGPLSRISFVQMPTGDMVACCTLHHIISDGWSVGVILFEMAAMYAAATGQSSQALPPLRIQYRDFAKWQRDRLQGAELNRLSEFWLKYLEGAPHLLDLPTDRPRPSMVTPNGAIYRFRLPVNLCEDLKVLCRRENTTIFTLLLAAYATLLFRYSDQQEMLIGVPVNGRDRSEVQPLVGYFINLIAVRVNLIGNPPFDELLRRVRESTLAAQSHQEIPFDKLVEALKPTRTVERTPLVQVVYLHQSFPLPSPEVSPGLHFAQMEVHPGFSRFELALRTEPDAHGIAGIFEYNTDLYDASTIAKLADHYITLLQSVAGDPKQRLLKIPVLTEKELQHLLRAGEQSLQSDVISPRMLRRAAITFVAPSTETEKRVANIWCELLKIDDVGIHDDFFELGGHSMLAMELITRLSEVLQAEINEDALFSDPTIFTVARLIDERGLRTSRRETTRIHPAPSGSALPLSSSQQLLYLMEQFEKGLAFNATLAFRIKGDLNQPVLERCLDEILRRHSILRSSIWVVDGVPVHVVNPMQSVQLARRDFRQLAEPQRETAATAWAEELTRIRFDLAQGNLIRFGLATLADTEQVLFIAVHHIVSDGWSFSILFRELVQLYQAFSTGRESPLPELPIQFSDFAFWQRNAADENASASTEYWKKRFGGDLPTLNLPLDHIRPNSIAVEPDVCELEIPAEIVKRLTQLGRREGATLYMTLLTGYLTLLQRLSQQDDILVGSTSANRLRPETFNLIGFFAGLLPLRCDLSEDPSYLTLLQRVRTNCVEAFSQPELRLDEAFANFRPPTPGMMPVCQTLFTFWEFPNVSETAGGLIWSPSDLNVIRVSGYDLVLTLRPKAEGMIGALLYRPDLFQPQTVARFRSHFLELLRAIAENPSARISELQILNESDKQQLLVTWNQTEAEFPSDKCLPELFESQVQKSPEASAIASADVVWTYQQLNQFANRVARQLQSLHVERESRVAILLERGPELVGSMLGVLKAGGAYLPVDPAWPAERIKTLLRDATPLVVITHRKSPEPPHWNFTEATSPFQILDVDSIVKSGPLSEQDDVNLPCKASPTSLAYIIYTSGSSGAPKGVMIEHRSVVNVVSSFVQAYNLGRNDRVLQQSSVAFDVSINEIFPVLCSGGILVIPEPHQVGDFDELSRLIQKHQITIMGATPSGLTELNRRAELLPSLRLVLSGGETLAHSHIDRLIQFTTVTNGYGPTEATVCATFFDLRELPDGHTGTIPIGKPLPNYKVYVLDDKLSLVPVGLPGELCIAGVGLARGYLGDPKLTSSKFVANPFQPGERIYRTGDEARWRHDGNLEFLGRLDRQVKVRGFRVELGEIEAVLAQHPSVKQSAVTSDRDASGNARVIAYVVATENGETEESIRSSLREHLASRLPHHLIPAVFMLVAAIPLTSNQKVDFAALPKPQAKRPDLDSPFVAARTPDEHALTEIWRAALGLDRVGIHDNFFLIGGHSLLAAQILFRVQQELSVTFSYPAFFQSPTVAQMAVRLDLLRHQVQTGALSEPTEVVPLVPLSGGMGPSIYCIHAFGGQIHEYSELVQRLGTRFQVFGLQSRATLDYTRESPSWQAIGEDYADVIRRHQPNGPYYLIGHSAGGVLALAIAHALEQTGETVGRLFLIDSYWNLDDVAVSRGAEMELVNAMRTSFGHLLPRQLGPWDSVLSDSDRLHEDFFSLSREERLQKLESLVSTIGIFPKEISEQLKSQLRLHDLHRTLFSQHVLQPIAAPISLAWANEVLPGTVSLERFDWSRWTSGEVNASSFEANHFSILKQPSAGQLVDWIVKWMLTR